MRYRIMRTVVNGGSEHFILYERRMILFCIPMWARIQFQEICLSDYDARRWLRRHLVNYSGLSSEFTKDELIKGDRDTTSKVLSAVLPQRAALIADIATLRQLVVSGFYEEAVPIFSQGYPTHALQRVVTAEDVTRYEMLMRRKTEQCASLIEELRRTTEMLEKARADIIDLRGQ